MDFAAILPSIVAQRFSGKKCFAALFGQKIFCSAFRAKNASQARFVTATVQWHNKDVHQII